MSSTSSTYSLSSSSSTYSEVQAERKSGSHLTDSSSLTVYSAPKSAEELLQELCEKVAQLTQLTQLHTAQIQEPQQENRALKMKLKIAAQQPVSIGNLPTVVLLKIFSEFLTEPNTDLFPTQFKGQEVHQFGLVSRQWQTLAWDNRVLRRLLPTFPFCQSSELDKKALLRSYHFFLKAGYVRIPRFYEDYSEVIRILPKNLLQFAEDILQERDKLPALDSYSLGLQVNKTQVGYLNPIYDSDVSLNATHPLNRKFILSQASGLRPFNLRTPLDLFKHLTHKSVIRYQHGSALHTGVYLNLYHLIKDTEKDHPRLGEVAFLGEEGYTVSKELRAKAVHQFVEQQFIQWRGNTGRHPELSSPDVYFSSFLADDKKEQVYIALGKGDRELGRSLFHNLKWEDHVSAEERWQSIAAVLGYDPRSPKK